MSNSIILRNPHSILAILNCRPKDVLKVTIPQKVSSQDDIWGKVADRAKEEKIPIISSGNSDSKSLGEPKKQSKSKEREGKRGRDLRSRASADQESQRMGGAEALVLPRASISLAEVFKNAKERKEGRGLWLALDTLQDPHNVGAIFRTAAFFGVEGIILTQDRSAPLTGTVYDVASGGLESVPFVIQPSLQQAFEVAKESGLWILGTSEHARDSLETIPQDRPWLLVLGNEEKGMRRLTTEACDWVCRISPRGQIVQSLNVSVAAGICISRFSLF